MRECRNCHKEFTPSKYHRRQVFCCANCCKYFWRTENLENRRAYEREYMKERRRNNPEYREQMRMWKRQAYAKHKYDPQFYLRARARARKARRDAIEAYGGCVCVCQHVDGICGPKSFEFLALDHIDGTGPRSKGRRGVNCMQLRRLGYPPGLRVLCHNCNSALGFYGLCPLATSDKMRHDNSNHFIN